MTTADVLYDEVADLGEGPLWVAPDRLTWVDILADACSSPAPATATSTST